MPTVTPAAQKNIHGQKWPRTCLPIENNLYRSKASSKTAKFATVVAVTASPAASSYSMLTAGDALVPTGTANAKTDQSVGIPAAVPTVPTVPTIPTAPSVAGANKNEPSLSLKQVTAEESELTFEFPPIDISKLADVHDLIEEITER